MTPAAAERARQRWLRKQAAFISKARDVHGDRYDYSRVEYMGLHTKVVVKCSLHGEFNPTPANHIHRGSGCPACAGNAPMTRASFLAEALQVHGDTYDYSAVTAPRAKVPARIVCRTHGVFLQLPRDHVKSASGCQACGRERTGASSRLTAEQFIARAAAIHVEHPYDYSRVAYVNAMTGVEIVCPAHGSFFQAPNNHLNMEQGCPRCGGTGRLTIELFIARSRVFHGDRYDYSRVVYVNDRTPVAIGCPEHGTFHQAPQHHGRGVGCPACSESHGERAVRLVLEGHGIEFEAQWTHPTMVLSRPLRADFALAARRILIEFDGQQHRVPVQFGGRSRAEALDDLDAIRARDLAKDGWAREFGWTLIRLTDPLTVEAELTAAGVVSCSAVDATTA